MNSKKAKFFTSYFHKAPTIYKSGLILYTKVSLYTGVACINTNRKFIGMELDTKYFEIAKQRIEEAAFLYAQNNRKEQKHGQTNCKTEAVL